MVRLCPDQVHLTPGCCNRALCLQLAWMGGRRRKLAQLAKARRRQPAKAVQLVNELNGALRLMAQLCC